MSHCRTALLGLFAWALGAAGFHSDASFVDPVLSASHVQKVGRQHPKKLLSDDPYDDEDKDTKGHANASVEDKDTEGHANASVSSGSHESTESEGESEMEHEMEVLEGHEKPTPVANSEAFMLLGMIIFQVALFYLVNFPDDDVQHFTWISLSHTISIFSSLTIWHTVKSTVEYFIGEETGANAIADEVPQERGHPFRAVILFSVLFAIFNALMSRSWSHRTSVSALGVIAAHTLGFAAVDGVGELLMEAPCPNMLFFNMITLLVGLTFLGLLSLATYVRTMVCVSWRDTEENSVLVDRYLQACVESENEFAGFVLGLLVTQAIVWTVTGSMPPAHGFSFEKSMAEVEGLMLGAGVTIVSLVLFVVFVRNVFKDVASPLRTRAIEITEMTLCMAVGWTFLFAGRWLFWSSTDDHGIGEGDLMSARMVQALAFSGFCFLNIIFFDYLGDREYMDLTALRAVMSTMGILMGLAWESAFGEAIENIGLEFASTPQREFTLMSAIGVTSSLVVLPAWYLYIFPQALMGIEADEMRELHQSGPKKAGWKVGSNGKLVNPPTSNRDRWKYAVKAMQSSGTSFDPSDWRQELRASSSDAAPGSISEARPCSTRE